MATTDQHGLFWNSENGDRTYDAESMSTWLRRFFTTGVFQDDCQVTATEGMVVQMGTGYANLEGKVRNFENVSNFTLEPASSRNPRIDTIVIERNDVERTIGAKAITGQYSGETPQPTAPVRSEGVFQIVVAQILVEAGVTTITQSAITDTRPDSTICGWVTGTVDEIDLSQILEQSTEQFDTWFDHMKGQLDEDAAGHLQNEIDELATQMDSVITRLYPVGSIYLSVNNINPSTIFGGTWVQLKDRFLLGAGDTYTAGDTGGEAEHTLTAGELPPGVLGVFSSNPDFMKELNGMSQGSGFGWLGRNNNGAPVEPVTNMPPYLVVYMWQRTA